MFFNYLITLADAHDTRLSKKIYATDKICGMLPFFLKDIDKYGKADTVEYGDYLWMLIYGLLLSYLDL